MKRYLLHFAAVYSIALVLLITVLIFGLNLGWYYINSYIGGMCIDQRWAFCKERTTRA